MTSLPEPRELLARARDADDAARAHDPAGYPRRHTEWRVWVRRQALASTLATALGVPVDQVTVRDDPLRGYGINHQYPGDLLTVTDPATGQAWRFAPDFTAAHSWLLLGHCPRCPATGVPVARIAGLADLGAWQRAATTHTADVLEDLQMPEQIHSDPGHCTGCPLLTDQ